jgi:protoporphyrinogen oxidase
MARRKAMVVGSGAAGLTAGWRLAQAGWQVEVLGAEPEVGGLLAPVQVGGWPCDLGAHRLHAPALQVPAVADLARRVPLERRRRRGRVLVGGRQFDYPLQLADLARGLGLRGGAELLASLATARLAGRQWEAQRSQTPQNDQGFADFVRSRSGEAAYQSFYRPYAEKVWGLDPAEISQSCAKQRVSSAAPWQLLWGARRGEFLHPQGGFGAWMAGLAQAAVQSGARVTLQQRLLNHVDFASFDADAVIHTGHLADALTPDQRQAAQLEHRGLFLLWLVVPDGRPGPVDTWYTPDARFAFGRVSEVANFLGHRRGRVLCVEIPQGRHPADRDWLGELPELRLQLAEAGILAASAAVSEVEQRFLPRVYPLFRRDWLPRWQTALQQVSALGRVWPAGRQGLWLHCNLDHAMASAEAAAGHVLSGATAGDWALAARRWGEVRVRD